MKKSAISIIVGFGIISFGAFASSSASLSWTGKVGSALASDDYMITGENGSTASDAFMAQLRNVESNATFDSGHIVLELRENNGSATSPTPGDLWSDSSNLNGSPVSDVNITWTVQTASAKISDVAGGPSLDMAALNSGVNPVVVTINGEEVPINSSYSKSENNQIGVRVKNTTPLNPNEVAGKDISVSVNVSATAA